MTFGVVGRPLVASAHQCPVVPRPLHRPAPVNQPRPALLCPSQPHLATGKPIRVNKASQDKNAGDVGANLFIGNLDPDVDEKVSSWSRILCCAWEPDVEVGRKRC